MWLLALLHPAVPHDTDVGDGAQAPLPLHQPALEQPLALHAPLGSGCPEGTEEQVPSLPATLQLMHSPELPSVQVVLQHTPSEVQMPLAHWALLAQVAPFDLVPHDWFTQVLGGTQSLSTWQLERQLLLAQVNLPHELFWDGGTQSPCPSQ